MAVNVTFTGNIYDYGGIQFTGSEVYYQLYFFKSNSGSSPSIWSDVRISILGQYNLNLADSDLLGTEGNASSGDEVIIVFWLGGDRMGTDCSILDEWSAFTLTLDSSSTYVNHTQVSSNILPTLDWSFPVTEGLVGTPYEPTNTSDDVHTWDWMGTTMGHYYIWQGQSICFVNHVNNSSYYWDDGNEDLNEAGISTVPHTWLIHGDYEVKIVIEDECGGTVTGTHMVRMRYPAPVPNIDCNEDNGINNYVVIPDTVVTFDYDGSNPYSRITSIDWVINDDTDTTSNGHAYTDIVPHTNGEGTDWYGHAASAGAFTDPGTHNVAIVVYWNDGFDDQTINYNENFIQDYFSGPAPEFDQVPDPVAVTSGVVFNNLTTNDGRVGTAGAGEEYDWEWNDEGNTDNVNDVPKSYIYGNTPGSDDVTVELCAHWNDGWNDHIVCEQKNLAIETTVVVVQNDCYYELTVFGTSLDGSVSGYHWEIERSTTSGISGPYDLIWESPEGMDQKEKTIAFAEENYFKITAYVHGNGDTTDYEVIYIDTVCPGEECTLVVWNGTGEHDTGGDWNHTGHGFEAAYAKYEGTNGLDATNFTARKKIRFQNVLEVNVDDYDLLSMYINLKEWPNGANTTLYFEDGNSVSISNYLQSLNLNEWQRVLIPIEDFGITVPVDVKKLTMESNSQNGFYLDNVEFVIGATIREGVIDVGRPEMEADPTNVPIMKAIRPNYKPTMRAFTPPANL